jgi:hypothetical protein
MQVAPHSISDIPDDADRALTGTGGQYCQALKPGEAKRNQDLVEKDATCYVRQSSPHF